MPQPIETLCEVRLKKLAKLRELGINPYPSKFPNRVIVAQARKQDLDITVRVAGRLTAWRGHGGLTFADLTDESGKIQLVFRKESLSPESSKLLPLLDIGDFLGVEGNLFKTKAGELTVEVIKAVLLSKAIYPIPVKSEVKDVEVRYRQRYLDWLTNPEAKRMLEVRSKMTAALRNFLINKKGYIEVETPLLQPVYGGGRARPFTTHHHALDVDFYLKIASELYLKQFIVGGFEKVFEISRVFRNEGIDSSHNPEFSLLETMHAYFDYEDNIELMEEMFEYVCLQIHGTTKIPYGEHELEFKRPWQRVYVREESKKEFGFDVLAASREEVVGLATKYGVNIRDYMGRDSIATKVFEDVVAVRYIQPTFVCCYPAGAFPFAKRSEADLDVVETFDVYVAGMEMGTNYTESNDPIELRQRLIAEARQAEKGDDEAAPVDEAFIKAVSYGMPPVSGLGPGIERWAMILANTPSIKDIIAFPTLKPEG